MQPAVWEHSAIEQVLDFGTEWGLTWAGGGSVTLRKSECAAAPRPGERLSVRSHGGGTPKFVVVIGEQVVRDEAPDWPGWAAASGASS